MALLHAAFVTCWLQLSDNMQVLLYYCVLCVLYCCTVCGGLVVAPVWYDGGGVGVGVVRAGDYGVGIGVGAGVGVYIGLCLCWSFFEIVKIRANKYVRWCLFWVFDAGTL